MNRKFEYSKHIMLWKHMANEKTIERIVANAKDDMERAKSSTAYFSFAEFNVIMEKKEYISNVFNEYVANGCYACQANVPCSACPIKIGRCSNGLYNKYVYAISNYTKTDNKEYLNEAIQLALGIANAELNKEVIEYYNIEVC